MENHQDFIIEDGVLTKYTGAGRGVTIPAGITMIGKYASSGCSNLQSVTIPGGTAVIGRGAFEGCASLQSVTIPESITKIGWGTFYGCQKLTIYAPTGSHARRYAMENLISFRPTDEAEQTASKTCSPPSFLR